VTFFTRYDELVAQLTGFRALFKPGSTLFLVDRYLDVPFDRMLPIGRGGERELIMLVCRGPGAGRLGAWGREAPGLLAPTSIVLP
jgi:hypothetical protein